MKKHTKRMSETHAIQQLQERMSILEMRLQAMSVKEIKPTKAELRAIRRAKKEMAEGKTVPWEKIKERYG